MKTYEKPMMKMVNLRNENTVAATCWGHHGTATVLWCDIPGQGYCSFQIGGAKCTLDLINVMYYEYDGATGVEATQGQINALHAKLVTSGGDTGNPFDGEGTIVTEGAPDPDWS